MTAGNKVVQIIVRRARPADCVNVFRVLRPQFEAQPVEVDDGKAIAFVLHLIENAYVVVADLSGRVVGAAVCSAYPPPFSREFLLDLEFLAAAPSFEQRGVKEALLSNVANYARQNGIAQRLTLSPADARLDVAKTMQASGFAPSSLAFAIGKSKYAELEKSAGSEPIEEPDDVDVDADEREWEPAS